MMLKTSGRPGRGVRETTPVPGPTSGSDSRSLRLAAAGWGLFFIWVATMFILGVPASVGLLGIAFITLGVQTARKAVGLRPEGFWLLVGLGFLLAAAWEIFHPGLSLISVLMILLGVGLLRSALKRRG